MSSLIESELKIPKSQQLFWLSCNSSYITCLVNESWLHCIKVKGQLCCTSNNLSEEDCLSLLPPSNSKLPSSWHRINVTIIEKLHKKVISCVNEILSYGLGEKSFEEMVEITRNEFFNCVTEKAKKQFSSAFHFAVTSSLNDIDVHEHSDLVRQVLKTMFTCEINELTEDGFIIGSEDSNESTAFRKLIKWNFPGLVSCLALLESQTAFYIIHPYSQYTVQDVVSFSPAKFGNELNRKLFVIYQILQTFRWCHDRCIPMGPITLNDIFVDERLWIRIKSPLSTAIFRNNEILEQNIVQNAENNLKPLTNCSNLSTVNHLELEAALFEWLEGKMSNFDYLMFLNRLAGRNVEDPEHYPIVPWVTDFSKPDGALRDLKLSKFRLCKGDKQLDITYNFNLTMPGIDAMATPHHVTDFLSSVTYYVYKARRTSKALLCRYVRSKWVPDEYPASIQRMQQWTPDECIPEFYTDPTIFSSIHSDLPDLQLPPWVQSAEDFISHHRSLLEGDYVSQNLHHWIDLTFGFKLSGDAAVRAKNVCLQLADKHQFLINHGPLQLFSHPHPQRFVPKQNSMCSPLSFLSPCFADDSFDVEKVSLLQDETQSKIKPPKLQFADAKQLTGDSKAALKMRGPESVIHIPAFIRPLETLERLDVLLDFCRSQLHHDMHRILKPDNNKNLRRSLISIDMQTLGCLVGELLFPEHLRCISAKTDLSSRYTAARSVCLKFAHLIPRPLQKAVSILLRLNKPHSQLEANVFGSLFDYDILSDPQGLPPPNIDILLHSAFSPFEFPSYFHELHGVLVKLKAIEDQLQYLTTFGSNENEVVLQRLAKNKVCLLANYIAQNTHILYEEGLIDILVPYVVKMLEDRGTAVMAAWLMFSNMARAMGPSQATSVFIPYLTKLLDEEAASQKHMKLYYHSFILQLMVCFRLDTFLSKFPTLLIEAVAGHKNFTDAAFVGQLSNTSDTLLDNDKEDPSNTPPKLSGVEYGVIATESFCGNEPESLIDNMLLEEDVFPIDPFRSEGSQATFAADNESISSDITVGGEFTGRFEIGGNENSDDGESIGGENIVKEDIASSLPTEKLSVGLNSSKSDLQQDFNISELQNDFNAEVEADKDTNFNDGASMALKEPEKDAKFSAASNIVNEASREQQRVSLKNLLSYTTEANISTVAITTVRWLANRLGPVLTAKHLSRNLLRMLALCYLGEEQLELLPDYLDCGPSATNKFVSGDLHAVGVLECLQYIVVLYGPHFILHQYLQHACDVIEQAKKKLSIRMESGLIGSIVLVRHTLPYLSDELLFDILKDILFKDILLPAIKLASSTCVSFPSKSQGRRVLLYKILDVLCFISLRIGFEHTREHMTHVLQKFFAAFSKAYTGDGKREEKSILSPVNSNTSKNLQLPVMMPSSELNDVAKPLEQSLYVEIKKDLETNEYLIGQPVTVASSSSHKRQGSLNSVKLSLSPFEESLDTTEMMPYQPSKDMILCELKESFTPELAYLAYVPFCKQAGDIFMEKNLPNDDLIRELCIQHDTSLSLQQRDTDKLIPSISDDSTLSKSFTTEDVNGFNTGNNGVGNKLTANNQNQNPETAKKKKLNFYDNNSLLSEEMKKSKNQHLRGNWLAYWENEIGLADRESHFDIKHMKLLTFIGHREPVKSLCVLDNEHVFMSASKDHTVKLWSIRNSGDGSHKTGNHQTYAQHKKALMDIVFIESLRLAASSDGSIHVWDPFCNRFLHCFESTRNSPTTTIAALPAPSTLLASATTDGLIRLYDIRNCKSAYSLRGTTREAMGYARKIAVSPDGCCLVAGYSSGVISVIDLRTGAIRTAWRGHDNEVLQVHAYDSDHLISSSIDDVVHLWGIEDARRISSFHCAAVCNIQLYKKSFLLASAPNKLTIFNPFENKNTVSSVKLKTEVMRGITSMAVLPLNRLLLLGSASGEITLVA